MVKTKPGTSEEVVRARRIRGVRMANSLLGRYDAIVVIEAKDLAELKNIIYEVLEKLPNVVHTETHLAIFHPPEVS